MSQYYQAPPQASPYSNPPNPAQNLQFYQSSYGSSGSQPPVSGHSTPFQAFNQQGHQQGYGQQGYGSSFAASGPSFGGFGGAAAGVSGRMGEQGGLRTGWLPAFGTEGYDGEPPLLEELGVNFSHIKSKTLIVLNPVARIDQHIMDDSDLAGPLLFFLLFGFFLFFSGKVYSGYIYGLAALGTTALYWLIALMSPPGDPAASVSASQSHSTQSAPAFSTTLTFFRSASILGYCLLPLVFTSLVGVVVSMDTLVGYLLTGLAIAWCTFSSSAMFCTVGGMRDMRGLVAYPVALFYVGFGIMGIFSSKGASGFAAVTAAAAKAAA